MQIKRNTLVLSLCQALSLGVLLWHARIKAPVLYRGALWWRVKLVESDNQGKGDQKRSCTARGAVPPHPTIWARSSVLIKEATIYLSMNVV